MCGSPRAAVLVTTAIIIAVAACLALYRLRHDAGVPADPGPQTFSAEIEPAHELNETLMAQPGLSLKSLP